MSHLELPDDLSKCSQEHLLELEDALDQARSAVRVQLRISGYEKLGQPLSAVTYAAGHFGRAFGTGPGKSSSNYANRPRWAQALGSLVDGPNRKKADRIVFIVAVLIVMMFALPGMLNTLITFGARYQASQYRGVPKPPRSAPTLSDESQ